MTIDKEINMYPKNIEEQVIALISLKDSVTKDTREFFKDESVDLEDRWNLFIMMGEADFLGDHDVAEFDGVDHDVFGYYDHFYLDKGQSIDAHSIYERLCEFADPHDYYFKVELNANPDAYRRWVLNLGHYNYVHDW